MNVPSFRNPIEIVSTFFCLVRPAEQEMRAAKMDVELLKHEIEINHLRKKIMSRKMAPSTLTFPPLVKINYNK